MPMDLYKVDDRYILSVDLTGVDPGSIDVDVDRVTLTLTAHRTAPEANGVQGISSEHFAGTFRRQVSLGEGIDVENILPTDVIEQHRDEPFDDDEYPRTTSRDPMAVA
ncbi:Hsp20/alpha crystallin family protein [Rhodococcus sp. PAMC28707]|nr:Hsp20/alpha crystallin family protein [Rhodococcus sp. PAMC28705]QCB58656.1 Hsp20/alpha crystallin family protein [Rhodococcus sp. PAMC28707]